MKNIILLLASLALGGTAISSTGGGEECPVAKKVTTLNASWEAASKKALALTPEAREEIGAKLAECAEKCPIGSRMGDTLSAVSDTLAFVAASSEACAENCPLEKLDATSEACVAGLELKTARTQAIAGLSKLAGYASGATCDGAGDCSASCSDSGCASDCGVLAKSCPIRIASRLGGAKASLAAARIEVQSLTAAERSDILASFATLAATNDVVKLLPETVAALSEGLTALNELHGSWANGPRRTRS